MAVRDAGYIAALARARALGIQVAQLVDDQIYRAYAAAIEQILTVEGAGHLTQSQAQALLNRLMAIFEEFGGRAITAVAAGTTTVLRQVIQEHRRQTERLLQRYGVTASPAWDRVPARARVMTASLRGVPTFRSLIKYRLDQRVLPSIEGALAHAMTSGMSSRELARQLAFTLVDNDPKVTRFLNKRSINALEKAGRIDEAKRLRGVLYDSRRIAVSEVNNQLRAANTASMIEGGIIAAAKWQRSGRHAGLPSTPCECDELAETDSYGYGPGMYPPEHWPDAPHPFCACYQGGPLVYKPVSEWGEPPAPVEGGGDGSGIRVP